MKHSWGCLTGVDHLHSSWKEEGNASCCPPEAGEHHHSVITARAAGPELSCSGAFCQVCPVHLQGQVSAQLILDSWVFIQYKPSSAYLKVLKVQGEGQGLCPGSEGSPQGSWLGHGLGHAASHLQVPALLLQMDMSEP